MGSGLSILIASIVILCPECHSSIISTNGTRKRLNSRVEVFICRNPRCASQTHKTPKQFILTTSHKFKEGVWGTLNNLFKDLMLHGAKNKSVAEKYDISCSQVSALLGELEGAISDSSGLDQLVDVPQPDWAVAVDETFLRIQGRAIYIIIATGYASRKILGIRVSPTRAEADMRAVFDEADANTAQPISAVTSDAWGATKKMVRNIGRDMTLITHRHKVPYDKVVINHYTYTLSHRVTTEIGVKTDVFTRRAVREYRHGTRRESLSPPTPRRRGRPIGVRNGQGRQRPRSSGRRGPRRFDSVFTNGKRGYLKADPYRGKLVISKCCPTQIASALGTAFELFCGKHIQNNLAENINSVLQSIIRLRGPRSPQSVERRLRALVVVRNSPSILETLAIKRNVRGSFFTKNLKCVELGELSKKGWEIECLKRLDGGVD